MRELSRVSIGVKAVAGGDLGLGRETASWPQLPEVQKFFHPQQLLISEVPSRTLLQRAVWCRGWTLFLRVSASWDCQGAPGTESGNALAGDRIQHLSVLCSQFLSLPRRRDTPVLPLHVLMVFPRLCARPRAAWKGSAGALPPGLVRLSIWQRACGPWEGLVARVTPPCLDAGGRENGLARECR